MKKEDVLLTQINNWDTDEFYKRKDEFLSKFSDCVMTITSEDEASCLHSAGRYRIDDLSVAKRELLDVLIDNYNKTIFAYLRKDSLDLGLFIAELAVKKAERKLRKFEKENNLLFYTTDELDKVIENIKIDIMYTTDSNEKRG